MTKPLLTPVSSWMNSELSGCILEILRCVVPTCLSAFATYILQSDTLVVFDYLFLQKQALPFLCSLAKMTCCVPYGSFSYLCFQMRFSPPFCPHRWCFPHSTENSHYAIINKNVYAIFLFELSSFSAYPSARSGAWTSMLPLFHFSPAISHTLPPITCPLHLNPLSIFISSHLPLFRPDDFFLEQLGLLHLNPGTRVTLFKYIFDYSKSQIKIFKWFWYNKMSRFPSLANH